MGTIEVELTLNQIRDDLKSKSDGLNEVRTVTFKDANGAGISISISCEKSRHPLKDWDKATFVDTGVSLMSLTLPKAKQMTIDQFKNPATKPAIKKKKAKQSQQTIIEDIKDEDFKGLDEEFDELNEDLE